MANTPEGTPYVESSDLVANYPAASLALANRVDLVGVLPFATSAARATAIPTPTDGQFTYLQDTNSTEFYNGSAYQTLGGKLLQVLSTAKTDTFSTTSATYVDVTGISVTVTPSKNTNVILVNVFLGVVDASAWNQQYFQLMRDSTAIGIGAAAGSRTRASMHSRYSTGGGVSYGPMSFQFLDSPATTSAITYKLQGGIQAGATLYVNRNSTDTDSAANARTASTITVMEISA